MTTHENMAKAICKYWSKYFINTANHTNGDSNCDLIGMVYDTLAMKEKKPSSLKTHSSVSSKSSSMKASKTLFLVPSRN